MAENNFWLASNSPRRREILSWLDWDISAAAANIDESRRVGEHPRDYVWRLASEKADARIVATDNGSVIIAADTIVALDDEILGKPRDAEKAFEMLVRLRARSHCVYTAIAVRKEGKVIQDICCSHVAMRNFGDDEIETYIASGDPMDKAGAYAIQNLAFHPAEAFNGCFASVMGMPLCHLERTLKKSGVRQPNGFAVICQNHLKYKCPISSRVMAGEEIG